MPWLNGGGPTTAGAGVELRIVPRDALERAPGGGHVVSEQPLPRGAFTITQEAAGGFRFDHAFYGRFHVTADGATIACAPGDLPDWLWQRFVIAQPLPLAAVLHGLEPLHAGAVVLGDRAVLLLGASGAGKSSVVLHLVARGARFLADDVAALELRGGDVHAHPGAAVASLDVRELARLPGDAAARWQRLGVLEGEARLLVGRRTAAPVPVGSIYVLRRTGAADGLTIGSPRLQPSKVLLGGTFNAYVRDPGRLARQLEIAGTLADAVTVREVEIPRAADAAAVAAAITLDAG